MMTFTAYKWRVIEDLPDHWKMMGDSSLSNLASIWNEQSIKLQNSDSLRDFNERLGREWAIETGIIENLYSIDRGITEILIEKGIEASLIPHGATDKPVDLVVSILEDQKEALDGLFDFVARRRTLSTSYIKELHHALTRHQETTEGVDTLGRRFHARLDRGEYKKLSNNPKRSGDDAIHEYCPPEHVSAEMDRLIVMHLDHLEKDVSPEVEAAWLHHRFTQIHPFQDGNGRVARALASLIFIRDHWFPLVINRDMREEYISALEEADHGDLSSLIKLFSKVQKTAFVKALSLSHHVLSAQASYQQLIAAAGEKLKARREAQIRERQKVFTVSANLEEITRDIFNEVSHQLQQELQRYDTSYTAFSTKSFEGSNDHWFRYQIIEVAKSLDYYADTRTYRAWVRLRIKEERQTELVVSFHSLGVEFLGVMSASAFIEYKDINENEEATFEGPYPLCNEVFQFSYNESEETVVDRYREWLNNVLLAGLDQWRRQL
jgi:Fic family protein